jgi:ribose 5-phosphate isomerase A
MNDKQLVALEAANMVRHGMMVGLGTGSTANYFIEAIAQRQNKENLQITTISSSVISSIKAKQSGLPVIGFEQLSHLDLYVDGADEVSPDGILLKGRGSDLVKEKILAKAAQHFVVLVDQSKLVNFIGEKFPIPIEVMPFAWQLVKKNLEEMGGSGELRPNANKDNVAVSAHGSLVLDMGIEAGISMSELNEHLNGLPGVVEHGIFINLASVILIGNNGEIEKRFVK